MPEEKEKFSTFKKFLMTVGIIAVIFIFLVILAALALVAYFVINKPFGIEINPLAKTEINSEYDHPLLSTEQEKTLQSLGVNLESIPTTITPTQEQCAVEVLGQDRVNQIKSGSAPSVTDYFKAKNCF
jgi:Na+-transporting methylmalonyl-CoA/oxaloacetate decarboxylase gamma subunit